MSTLRDAAGLMALMSVLAPAAEAAPINEPDFLGRYGDTVSYTSSPLAIGSTFDDQNSMTVGDMVAGYVWSIGGFDITGAAFSLTLAAPDYLVAFPSPGVYTLDFFYVIDALDAVTLDPVPPSRFHADSRTITLTIPAPAAAALAPMGCALAFGRRRSRRADP